MSNKLKKISLSTLIIISIVLSYMVSIQSVAFASIDIKESNTKALVLMEKATGKVLYESNKDKIIGQASVTKLMTYYVVRDYIKKSNTDLSKKITIDADFSKVPTDGTQLKLKKGDVLKLKELLESLLIMSANDSAIQLEKMVEDATGKNFLILMNDKAREIGLNKTKYINTSGLTEELDGKKIYNTTTAYEIAVLSKKIIDDYPDTLKITSKKSFEFNGVPYLNTNKLLSIRKNVDGLKTGYTTEAGYCLASTETVSKTSGNSKPFRLIAISLGSDTDTNRTNINSKLLNYGESNFENSKVVKKEDVFNVASEYHKGGIIPSKVKDDVYYLLKKGSKIEIKDSIRKNLKSSVKKGDIVGKLIIKIDKFTIEEDLIATNDVKRVNVFKRIGLFFKNLF